MANVIASVAATSAIPQRIVGNVAKSKDGNITIEYKKPGQIKTSNKIFGANDSNLIAYMEGAAGFVVALVNDPVAVMVGEMTTKESRTLVETAAGKVVILQRAGVMVNFDAVDEDSKEARSAERAAKVKGVKIKKDKSEKKGKKSKKDKSEKSEKSSKKEGKKDKGDKKKKKKSKD